MIFAMVFTISCSGEDGKNGRNGDGCTVVPNGSNFDIVCGEDVIGTLRSGKGGNGSDGEPGEPGNPGEDGEGCIIGTKVNGSYTILCGPKGEEELQGTLDGCQSRSFGEYEILIACGDVEVSLCDGLPFDATKDYCKEDGTGIVEGGAAALVGECDNNVKYNTRTHYCSYAKKGDTISTPTLLCKGKSTDEGLKPNEAVDKTKIWEKDADGEFCEFTSDTTVEKSKPIPAGKECAGAKMNEGSWKAQYCGFANNKATVKTVQTGVCDFGGGPNEIAYAHGYCQVQMQEYSSPIGLSDEYQKALAISGGYGKPAKITVYVDDEEDFCLKDNEGKSIRDNAKSRMNEGTWKQEYCGWKDEKASQRTVLKAANDTCAYLALTDGINEELVRPKTAGDVEYCQFDYSTDPAIAKNDFVKWYKVATPSECGDNKKVNENGPKKQFCGWKSFGPTSADSKMESLTAANDSCAKIAPNHSSDSRPESASSFDYCEWDYNLGKYVAGKPKPVGTNLATPNKDKPNKQYIGFRSIASTSKEMLSAANDSCAKLAPNSGDVVPSTAEAFQYCEWDYKQAYLNKGNGYRLATPSEHDGKKINESQPRKQFVGYTAAGDNAQKVIVTAASDSCAAMANIKGMNSTKPADRTEIEYCQQKADWSYDKAKPSDTNCGGSTGTGRLNQDSWKGQYCFADDKIATCTGGKIADESKNSNDPEELRCKYE
jgi:hypothetical protein